MELKYKGTFYSSLKKKSIYRCITEKINKTGAMLRQLEIFVGSK